MELMIAYVNNQNELCECNIDDINENACIINTKTQDVFEPLFVDGIDGILDFINDNIKYIKYCTDEWKNIIFNHIEDKNNCISTFDYLKKLLKEW